jgi:predicted O-linked N-acetylglucosamine transferase (SPINDLY family)
MPRRTTLEALELARLHAHAGRWDLCSQLCEAIMRVEPDQAEALHLAGVARHQQGDPRSALEFFRRAAAVQPNNAQYQTNLGAAYDALGSAEQAFACFRRALEIDPHMATAHYNMANIFRQARPDEAEAAYRRALAEKPEFPAALLNLSTLLADQSRTAEALACLERALAIDADSPQVLNNLGILYRDLGRSADAEACYRRAIRRVPTFAEAHCNLGGLLKQREQIPAAEAAYREALRLKPDLFDALQGLAGLYKEHAHGTHAADCYRRALALRADPLVRFELATLLPAILDSAEQIGETRTRLAADLAQLAGDGVRLDFCKTTPHTLFYLAYQGLNDRPLHKLVASLVAPRTDDATSSARRSGPRLRVGFVSKMLQDHTIGQLWQNMIAGLARDRFDVFLWSPPTDDAVSQRIRARADHWTALLPRAALIRPQIADAALDVLVFPEVGMDPVVWALASTRLAPVQCVGWGHPVTTGFPTVDYFLSSRLMEPADADDHYTERLVRFDGFGLCIDRPQLSAPAARADFGLPDDRRLYGCLQSLFKIHPDDDPLLAEVLRRDPGGELVLLEGTSPAWREALVRRLAASMPDVLPRVRFLPRQTSDNFLRLASLMDVMLDPLHFSGGRTSYEALALGVPVVTLPSGLLRGRITLGVYRAMGVDDCIVADKTRYVELALRIAGDADYRRDLGTKILAAADGFFNDRLAIREFELFLERVAR